MSFLLVFLLVFALCIWNHAVRYTKLELLYLNKTISNLLWLWSFISSNAFYFKVYFDIKRGISFSWSYLGPVVLCRMVGPNYVAYRFWKDLLFTMSGDHSYAFHLMVGYILGNFFTSIFYLSSSLFSCL